MNTETPAAIEPQATPLPAPKPKLTLPKQLALPKDGPALMKSFDRDPWGARLAALFLVRLPMILAASSVPTLAVAKVMGWW